MSVRRFRSTFFRLALAVMFIIAGRGLAFAQADFNESTIPPSAPPSRAARPSTVAEPSDETDESAAKAKPDHPANTIPYTVRPGDSVGAIAQMFGITAEELAHANRIHTDEELQIDEVLKVPHPFTTEVNTLKGQVETLVRSNKRPSRRPIPRRSSLNRLRARCRN